MPYALTTDSSGNVYVADMDNLRIRKVDAQTGIISTVAQNRAFAAYFEPFFRLAAAVKWLVSVRSRFPNSRSIIFSNSD